MIARLRRRIRLPTPSPLTSSNALNLLTSVLGLWSSDMGIDLDTPNTLLYVHCRGIVLDHPPAAAARRPSAPAPTVSPTPPRLPGRTPPHTVALRPLRA